MSSEFSTLSGGGVTEQSLLTSAAKGRFVPEVFEVPPGDVRILIQRLNSLIMMFWQNASEA